MPVKGAAYRYSQSFYYFRCYHNLAMKKFLKPILFLIYDILLVPFSYLYLPFLKQTRRFGVQNFPLHKKAFRRLGVFPLQDHYYEPQFTFPAGFDASVKRNLLIDFRIEAQIENLGKLQYADELEQLPQKDKSKPGSTPLFYVNNPAFGPGDSDMYYLMIRNFKPRKIVEIGSGFSTLAALEAIRKNNAEGFPVELTCIEPFETGWLDTCTEIRLIRKKLEEIDLSFFASLEVNDILFIDSSHVIRPENDVLYEYLQLLPKIGKGVLIHIHDIFSPRNYRQDWITEEVRLWDEQYLLEAFLYYNQSFQIEYSLNYLKNDHYEETSKILLNLTHESQPASFWMRKIE